MSNVLRGAALAGISLGAFANVVLGAEERAFKQAGGQHAVMLKSPFDLAGFKDYKGGDLRFSPAAAAPLTDAGEIVKGVNDGGPEAWQYKGKAPDIGLVEAGEALPHYGPRPAPKATERQEYVDELQNGHVRHSGDAAGRGGFDGRRGESHAVGGNGADAGACDCG